VSSHPLSRQALKLEKLGMRLTQQHTKYHILQEYSWKKKKKKNFEARDISTIKEENTMVSPLFQAIIECHSYVQVGG
jgi:ribonuclease BN (tRNA processing enzyme)